MSESNLKQPALIQRFPLRLSPELHAAIAAAANENERSMNMEIVHVLKKAYELKGGDQLQRA